MWPRVDLGGYSHAIPRVCPNCLAEAREPVVCYHKDAFSCFFYPFGPAAQTFFYCESCAEQARAGVRCDRLRRFLSWFFSLLPIFFCAALPIGLVAGRNGPLSEYWMRVPEAVKLGAWFAMTAVLWLGIVRGYRWRQKRRHPQTAAQAVWGVAAYFTSFSNYKASRPEWIQALVRCNPQAVKPKVYRRITGDDRPE